jgi:hypothetical protein
MRSLTERLKPRLPGPLALFLVSVLGIFAVNYLDTRFRMRHALPVAFSWPYTGFDTGANSGIYRDFTLFEERIKLIHTAAFFSPGQRDTFMYPASIAVLLDLLYKVSFHTGLVVTLIWMTAGLGGVGMILALHRRGMRLPYAVGSVLLTLLCSYPFWFELFNANMEVFVWAATMSAIWALCVRRDTLAAVLIGIAGALKIYPILFCAIFLTQRKYRQVLISAGTFAAIWASSIAFVGPTFGVAYRGISGGINEFVVEYAKMWRGEEMGFDHSIVALIKTFLIHVHVYRQPIPWLSFYLGTGALLGLGMYVFRLRRLPMANHILVLSILCVILPPVSYDYTLVNLYAAWAVVMLLYTGAGAARRNPLPGQLLAVGFALVFTETEFFRIHVSRVAGAVRCLVLLAMVGVGLRWPLPDRPESDGEDQPNELGEAAESRAF